MTSFSVKDLFIQWLTVWRDEAKSEAKKSQYTYSKALRSIQKFPLPVTCGEDVKILEFFGDKLCKMLDSKLNKYKEEHGDVSVARQADEQHVTQSQKKRHVSAREYIPMYRSGPYALILTLYQDFQTPRSKGYMTKAELQRLSQDLSDKSMTVTEGDCRYTAWSSMSSLISKGYVTRDGNPCRYTITPSGCELAHKLEVGHDEAENLTRDGPSPRLPIDPATTQPPSSRTTLNPRVGAAESHSTLDDARESSSFQYTYIDDQGKEVACKDSAVVLINDSFGVGFLVKCIECDLIKFNIQHQRDPRRAPAGIAYVYIDNDQALDLSPGLNNSKTVQKRTLPNVMKSSNFGKKQKTLKEAEPAKGIGIGADKVLSVNEKKLIRNTSSTSTFPSDTVNHAHTFARDLSEDDGCTSKGSDLGSSQENESSVRSSATAEFTLYPGTFEIVLCVDNCEIGGASKRKKQLLEGLQKNGVHLDVRKLQVGDFLWVVRKKANNFAQSTHNREAVLDYIIERKRMDDLCGSIKDGRFKEQKFRLKQCGIIHTIYLVENYGSMDDMSLPKATLQQAIVNTQVVDKFHVKHTYGINESVAYLTIMTRYLQSHYANKTITAYTRENLEKINARTDLNQSNQNLMSFVDFNENSIKNKVLTTGEVFAKQLLQFSGLTAEKAHAIITIYPTVSHLLDAYSNCSSDNEAEKQLSTLKFGKTQRNLGPALSKLICQVYTTPGPLT